MEHLNVLLANLHALKPNDRSERDRLYAVVITEVEKLKALMSAWDIRGE